MVTPRDQSKTPQRHDSARIDDHPVIDTVAQKRRRLWLAFAQNLGSSNFEWMLVAADEMGPAPDGIFFWNWAKGKQSGARRGVLFLGAGCCRMVREFMSDEKCDDLALFATVSLIRARP